MNSFAWHFLCHKRNFEYLSLKQFHIFLLSCTVQYQRQSLTQVTVTYKLIIEAQVQTQSKYIVCYSYLVATFSLLTTYFLFVLYFLNSFQGAVCFTSRGSRYLIFIVHGAVYISIFQTSLVRQMGCQKNFNKTI